jgi:ParG protein
MMTEPPAEDPPPESTPPEPEPPQARREEAQPSSAAGTSLDASRILVRALAQLPAEDRDKVYTWLLGTSLRMQPGVMEPLGRRLRWAVAAESGPVTQQDFGTAGADLVRDLFRGSSGSAQQMVPVRFSADQHARLRAWCSEHGFSMATVIRGLVDRFLDSQQPEIG